MPRFVDDSERKVIQADWWGEKETCTIRRFNYGDRQYLAGQTVRVGLRPGQDTSDVMGDVQVEQMNLAILQRGIVEWTDEKGNAVPVTMKMIQQLEEEEADFILGEINELNPQSARTKEEQASFRGDAGNGVEEE